MKKILLISVIAAVLAAGGAFYTLKNKGETQPSPDAATTAQVDVITENTNTDINYDSASLPSDPLGVRTLGNPDAPIKIEEFASLTCGHCAHFHGTTFQEIKTKYIDTGKVFFTFTDFPLNGPALDAAMVVRCMPPERYFTFLSFLFQTQEQWAFNAAYKDNLRQNAKLAGLSDEAFDACLANESLKQGLVDRMQAKSTENNINSTPSFVITSNNGKKEVLTGALPIVSFDKAIESAESIQTDGDIPPPAQIESMTKATEMENATTDNQPAEEDSTAPQSAVETEQQPVPATKETQPDAGQE